MNDREFCWLAATPCQVVIVASSSLSPSRFPLSIITHQNSSSADLYKKFDELLDATTFAPQAGDKITGTVSR